MERYWRFLISLVLGGDVRDDDVLGPAGQVVDERVLGDLAVDGGECLGVVGELARRKHLPELHVCERVALSIARVIGCVEEALVNVGDDGIHVWV